MQEKKGRKKNSRKQKIYKQINKKPRKETNNQRK